MQTFFHCHNSEWRFYISRLQITTEHESQDGDYSLDITDLYLYIDKDNVPYTDLNNIQISYRINNQEYQGESGIVTVADFEHQINPVLSELGGVEYSISWNIECELLTINDDGEIDGEIDFGEYGYAGSILEEIVCESSYIESTIIWENAPEGCNNLIGVIGFNTTYFCNDCGIILL